MADYDAVCVGSGINSLVAGALLARAGWRVAVVERNDYLGGAVKTSELTAPGFRHDVFSTSHALFLASPAYRELRDELEVRGLAYVRGDLPAASLFPDGASAFVSTSEEANAEEFGRFGPGEAEAWRAMLREFRQNEGLVRALLGSELWSVEGALLLARAYRRLGRHGLLEFGGDLLVSCRDWVTEAFRSPVAHGLLAPWSLHAGLGPDAASSGFATQAIAGSLQRQGAPLPLGGGVRLIEALAGIIRDAGGSCETGHDVAEILVRRGRAVGVRLEEGDVVTARRAVIANVTPTQLFGRLLPAGIAKRRVEEAARRFRYGRARMLIHLALRERPDWIGDGRLLRAATIHLTDGLDGVSCAVNEAERGFLPARGTISCSQPTAIDPTRAPEGCSILMIQLHEVPWRPTGDAAGKLNVRDGVWTEELRDRYADRILERLGAHISNLESALVGRVAFSPADLAAANINFVRGDASAGSCSIDQNLVFRPVPALPGHRTSVRRLYIVGASTHPGPGLGAGSGTIVARRLLGRRSRLRVGSRA